MSVFGADGSFVADTGTDFERSTAAAAPEFFNSNHEEAEFDSRSDDRGPEPEGIVVGEVGGTPYAFIGFERVGGIAVYDMTDVRTPKFVTYVNNRNFDVDPEENLSGAGNLGPEGLTEPMPGPTAGPTDEPTAEPTGEPTAEPTGEPTDEPTGEPTEEPTTDPTTGPTAGPTAAPTGEPTKEPTTDPTTEPTAGPTAAPTGEPTARPTSGPKPGMPVTGISVGLIALGSAALLGGGLLASRRRK